MRKIVEKIEEKIGSSEIVKKLADNLSSSEFNSLFMEILNEKSQKLTPSEVLYQFQNNRFVIPSIVNPSGLVHLLHM